MVEDIVPGKKKFHMIFFNPLRQLFRTIARKSEKKIQNRDTLLYIIQDTFHLYRSFRFRIFKDLKYSYVCLLNGEICLIILHNHMFV